MDITRRSVGWQKFGKRCSLKVANYYNDMNDGRWKIDKQDRQDRKGPQFTNKMMKLST